jgi:YcaO-like protein with predicted kinase domain
MGESDPAQGRVVMTRADEAARGSTAKTFRRGTHRAASPPETVARARRLMGPIGITRVSNVTGLDCIGIPVVMVCRPNARSLAVSQGKGLDLDSAKASGLMEAIELFHAERIDHPLKLGSWNDLRFSHQLAPVHKLPRTSASVFGRDSSILWIRGMDLMSSEAVWLPFEMVHTNFTLPLPTGSGCFVMTSNGLASGNRWAEAVAHGLYELIERDATVLFRLKSTEQQEALRVDLGTVVDPDCRALLAAYDAADVSVGVWDMTSDIRIPAYQCVAMDRQPGSLRRIGPIYGMGCHTVREIALLRALAEAAQGRLTLIAGSRDDNGRAQFQEAADGKMSERARQRLARRGSRPFGEAPTYETHTFEEDIALIGGALRSAGITNMIVVDLTKPEFRIPVVRVVVAGLEAHPNVSRYVPGERARRMLDARAEGNCG